MAIPGAKELIEGAFKWIDSHFSFRYFAMFFILSVAFLFGINPLLARLGLPSIPSGYRVAAAAASLIFGAGVIFFTFEGAIKKIGKWRSQSLADEEIRNHLHALPADQARVLLQYVQSGKSSQMFDPFIGAVCDLERRGILYQSSNVAHRKLGVLPYTIAPQAMKYLRQKEFQKILLDQRTD